MIEGKISYMAPELFSHVAPTPSSDVYACAVMLHELLVGRNEFKADHVPATAIRVMQHVPSFVSAARSDVPPELDAVLQRALKSRPKSASQRAGAGRRAQSPSNRASRAVRRGARASGEGRLHDSRMAELLGVDDPSTLERAWRDLSQPLEGPTMPVPMPQFDPNIPVYDGEAMPGLAAPSIPTVAAAPVALAAKGAQGTRWSMTSGSPVSSPEPRRWWWCYVLALPRTGQSG